MGPPSTPDLGMPGIHSRAADPRSTWKRWIPRDPYTIAAWCMFLATVVFYWTPFVVTDEELYFLGSRRIADPGLLALDLTWSRLPPTSALFDHLVAPLWSFLDEFAIANLGRLVIWGLMAWATTLLARTARLPAWSVAVGFAVWLLWRQTLFICGSVLEGFQVKSFSYPLLFFALTFALRGKAARAGMAAGLATAFHIIVGGWGFLALFVSMLVNRRLFPLRQVLVFVLAGAPFILPILASVALFHGAHTTAAERALMDEIYVMFAMSQCCDPPHFMEMFPRAWQRTSVVFAIAPIVVFAWPERRAARFLGTFVTSLIVIFVAGIAARGMDYYALLTLFPFQLANGLVPMFVFIFTMGWIGIRGPTSRAARVVGVLVLAGAAWLVYDRKVVPQALEAPSVFASDLIEVLEVGPAGEPRDSLFAWIKRSTPRNSVFITPLIPEFWPYAERAQVVSMRHPPLDRRIIEWKERLEAVNGFRPFIKREFDILPELSAHESTLTIPQLIQIRERYGATHYLAPGPMRKDLADHFLYSDGEFSVYDVAGLKPRDAWKLEESDSRASIGRARVSTPMR